MPTQSSNVEFKFLTGDAKTGEFSGYGAIFGNIDHAGDIIEAGAFRRTLSEWKSRGKLPKMLLQHGGLSAADGLPIGKWDSMEEDGSGLKVSGVLDPMDTDEARKIYAGLKNGTLDGLSIGFRTKKFTRGIKAGDARRIIHDIDLDEVSIVTFPANPKSLVSSVKSQISGLTPEECREIEAILRSKDFSGADAVKAVSGFKQWLRREDAGTTDDVPREDGALFTKLLATMKGVRAEMNP